MKTSYSEIVNENYIGKTENPIPMNEILKKANEEKLEPSSSSLEKVLFLGIDVQQDFMDNGALGVSGAHEDVARMTKVSFITTWRKSRTSQYLLILTSTSDFPSVLVD